MAKVGFWLQGATGKLAGSKLQGGVNGTIIADNTKKPKNPKTVNQILQRVLLNTVSQGYSKLQPICFHAFEGITEGAKSMFEFQKLNLEYFRERAAEVGEEQLSAYVNFVPVGEKGIRPAAFIVSDGSLPTVGMSINASYNAVMALDANTYADVISKYDLERGDQLTFVAIVESTTNPGKYQVKFARIILDPRNADGTAAALSSALINGSSINLPNSKNAGNFGLLQYANGMEFNFKANEKVCSVACIVSREVNKEWKRSFAQMVVSEAAIAGYSISLSRAIARSQQGAVQVPLTSGNQYLNNAGTGGTQSTDSGSGESQEEQESAAPTVSQTVGFGNVNQNVAGGSVEVAEGNLVNSVVIRGTNLTEDYITVVGTSANFPPISKTVNAAKTEMVIQFNEGDALSAGDSFAVSRNLPDLGLQLWFECDIVADDDKPAED